MCRPSRRKKINIIFIKNTPPVPDFGSRTALCKKMHRPAESLLFDRCENICKN